MPMKGELSTEEVLTPVQDCHRISKFDIGYNEVGYGKWAGYSDLKS